MTQPSSNTSRLFQALEKRFMFDAAAASTVEKAVDLSDGASAHEQQEVMAALSANSHVIQTQSLMDALGEHLPVNEDYTQVKEVILIDSRVLDPQQIIASIGRDAAVEIVNFGQDGVAQIAAILANYHNLDAVHIISHGSDGQLELGNTVLNLSNINQHASELAAWGQSLSATGDILLYGCDVAEGTPGIAFVEALSQLTSAEIAASTDPTGGNALGGDWELEHHKDVEKTSIVDEHDYAHLLVANFSNYNASSPAGLIAPTIDVTLDVSSEIEFISLEILVNSVNHTFLEPTSVWFSQDSTFSFDGSLFYENGVAFASFTAANPSAFTYNHTISPINQEPNLTADQAELILRHMTFSLNNLSNDLANKALRVSVVDFVGGSTAFDQFDIQLSAYPHIGLTSDNPLYDAGSTATSIFSNVTTVLDSGNHLKGMTFTMTNVASGDKLIIGGNTLNIDTNGSNITYNPGGGNITIVTSLSGSTATVSFTGGNLSNSQVSTFIDSITFQSSSTPQGTDKIFTITQIVESNGSTDTNALPGITSIVHVQSISDLTPGASYNPLVSTSLIEPIITFTLSPAMEATQLSVTIPVGEQSGDNLSLITDSTLSLSGSLVYDSNGIAFASYSDSGSGLVFTVHGASEFTQEQLTLLVRHISFANPSTDSAIVGASRLIVFTIHDNHTGQDLQENNLFMVNPSTDLIATGKNPNYNGGTATALFESVQSYTANSFMEGLTLTATNIKSTDTLLINGSALRLDQNASTTISFGGGQSINVSSFLSGATATVTFSAGNLTTANFNALIQSLAFETDSPLNTTKTFTITSISDSTESHSESISSAVRVTATAPPLVTRAPSIFTNSSHLNSASDSSSTLSTISSPSSNIEVQENSPTNSASPVILPPPMRVITKTEPQEATKIEPVKTDTVTKNLLVNFKEATDEGNIKTLNKLVAYLKNVSAAEVSKIAISIYELAVTDSKNNVTLLEKVVHTMVSAIKNEKALDAFLERVASDTQVSLHNRSAIVHYLSEHGKQKEARMLLDKLAKTTRDHSK